MKSIRVMIVAAIAMCALTGCGMSALVAAYNDPAVEYGRSFYVTSGMVGVPDGDLEFRQFARYLSNALESRGYRAADKNEAELEVRLSYSMGAPLKSYSSSYDEKTQTHSSDTSTSYYKQMTIVAMKGGEQVWKVNVSSNSGDDNFPEMVPYMLAAAQDYFGRAGNRDVTILYGRKIKVITGE